MTMLVMRPALVMAMIVTVIVAAIAVVIVSVVAVVVDHLDLIVMLVPSVIRVVSPAVSLSANYKCVSLLGLLRPPLQNSVHCHVWISNHRMLS